MDLVNELNKALKKHPTLARSLRDLKRRVHFGVHGYDPSLYQHLRLFAPYGAGDPQARIALALQSASQTLPLLAQLSRDCAGQQTQELTASEFCKLFDGQQGAVHLQRLFFENGSDKATFHNYHFVYGSLFRQPSSVRNLLEIGLGTNNLDVVSNMGKDGKPGASLRAFREYLPNADIFGADVDKRVLFQEDRIRTFYVDQTNLESFSELAQLDLQFDLIIDDGLHSPNANIAVLLFGLKRLAPRGWIVIEDIRTEAVPVWRIVGSLLSARYRSFLVEAERGFLFAVTDLDLRKPA